MLRNNEVSVAFAKEEAVPRQGPWVIKERITAGESYVVATANKTTQRQINQALQELREEGVLARIIRKWIPS